MSRLRSTALYFVAAAMGAATMAAVGYQWLPAGVIAVAFALFFILTLPRHPWFVAAFCAGAVLTVGVAFVAITVAWSVPAS